MNLLRNTNAALTAACLTVILPSVAIAAAKEPRWKTRQRVERNSA